MELINLKGLNLTMKELRDITKFIAQKAAKTHQKAAKAHQKAAKTHQKAAKTHEKIKKKHTQK